MDDKPYRKLAATIFLVVATLHLIRGIWGFELIIGNWDVQPWFNVILAALIGYVSWMGFKE